MQLSDRIGQLLSPIESGFNEEEKDVLFDIQTYLLGIVQPLRLCSMWTEQRFSCVSMVLSQVEVILREVMTFVHPLLLGQRPIAAAHSLWQSSHASNSRGPPSLYDYRNLLSSGAPKRTALRPTEAKMRASLAVKLAHCSHRLALASHLLQSAMTTVQMVEHMVPARPPKDRVCLVTLLAAHQRLMETAKCSGDLITVRGHVFFFYPAVLADQDANRLPVDERGFRTTLREIRHAIDVQTGGVDGGLTPAESTPANSQMPAPEVEVSTQWHRLPRLCELKISRASVHQKPTLSLTMPLPVRAKRVTGKELIDSACPPLIGKIAALKSMAQLLAGVSLTWPSETSQYVHALPPSEMVEEQTDSCMCMKCVRWETAGDGAGIMAFENVCVDEGDDKATNCEYETEIVCDTKCTSEPGASSILQTTSTSAGYLSLGAGIFGNKSASAKPPFVMAVTDTGSRRRATNGLEFVYMARLLEASMHDACASVSMSPNLLHQTSSDWLENCSHELLTQMLSL